MIDTDDAHPDLEFIQRMIEQLLDPARDGSSTAPDGSAPTGTGLEGIDLESIDLEGIAQLLDTGGEVDGRGLGDAARLLAAGGTLADVSGFDRDDLEALYTVASALFEAGDTVRAHRTFQFLCIHSHLESRYWLALGIAQATLGRHEHALYTFVMGSLIAAEDPRFPLHSAQSLLRLGDFSQARSEALAALALSRGGEHETVVGQEAERLLATLASHPVADRHVTGGDAR